MYILHVSPRHASRFKLAALLPFSVPSAHVLLRKSVGDSFRDEPSNLLLVSCKCDSPCLMWHRKPPSATNNKHTGSAVPPSFFVAWAAGFHVYSGKAKPLVCVRLRHRYVSAEEKDLGCSLPRENQRDMYKHAALNRAGKPPG